MEVARFVMFLAMTALELPLSVSIVQLTMNQHSVGQLVYNALQGAFLPKETLPVLLVILRAPLVTQLQPHV